MINIENHIVISNSSPRVGKRGRPSLIVDNTKYIVHTLTQSEVVNPWGVEIVWEVLTPVNIIIDSNIPKKFLPPSTANQTVGKRQLCWTM